MIQITGIKDNFADCLFDFSRKVDGDQPYRQTLYKLLGVYPKTIGEWLDKHILPVGLNLLRLYLLLEMHGYQISERMELNPAINKFSNYLALGVIGINEAVKILNVSDTQGVYRILLGRKNTSREKIIRMKIFCSEKKWQDAAEQKKAHWFQALGLNQRSEAEPETRPPDSSGIKEKAEKVKYLLLLLETELRYFRDGKPEDRNVFRKILDSGDIGYISSLLGMLGEENAFQRWKSLSTYRFKAFKGKESKDETSPH